MVLSPGGTHRPAIRGLVDGSLAIGSRAPVDGTPAWVTLEVLHGGFATGRYAAVLALDEHEDRLLATLPKSSLGPRAQHNAYYLGAGSAELEQMLAEGRYTIDVTEEGALLVSTWLSQNGEGDRSAALLEVIGPRLDRLRFYPKPRARPPRRPSAPAFIRSSSASPRSRATSASITMSGWAKADVFRAGRWATTGSSRPLAKNRPRAAGTGDRTGTPRRSSSTDEGRVFLFPSSSLGW